MSIELTVNGARVTVGAGETTPLLDVLRNELDLKGARYGCGLEQCGSCMVLVDGEPVYACSREVGTVAGRHSARSRGLAARIRCSRRSWKSKRGSARIVCRVSSCRPRHCSIAMRHRHGTEIVAALDKHLCRCGAHPRILRAVEKAAAALREGATP